MVRRVVVFISRGSFGRYRVEIRLAVFGGDYKGFRLLFVYRLLYIGVFGCGFLGGYRW